MRASLQSRSLRHASPSSLGGTHVSSSLATVIAVAIAPERHRPLTDTQYPPFYIFSCTDQARLTTRVSLAYAALAGSGPTHVVGLVAPEIGAAGDAKGLVSLDHTAPLALAGLRTTHISRTVAEKVAGLVEVDDEAARVVPFYTTIAGLGPRVADLVDHGHG
jgi:hypothetical protein